MVGESKTTINKSVCNCCGAFASHLTAHQGQKRHRDALVRSCPNHQFHLPSAISGTAPWMDISNPLLRGALSSLFTLSRLLPRPMETSFNRKTVSSSSGPSRHVPGMTIKGYPPSRCFTRSPAAETHKSSTVDRECMRAFCWGGQGGWDGRPWERLGGFCTATTLCGTVSPQVGLKIVCDHYATCSLQLDTFS